MFRPRVLGFTSLLMGVFSMVSVSVVFSETPPSNSSLSPMIRSSAFHKGLPAPSVQLVVSPVVSMPVSEDHPAVTEPVPLVETAPKAEAIRPMTVEGYGGLSLDQLRREVVRYPDQGLLGRFVEKATELPPLFGSDSRSE